MGTSSAGGSGVLNATFELTYMGQPEIDSRHTIGVTYACIDVEGDIVTIRPYPNDDADKQVVTLYGGDDLREFMDALELAQRVVAGAP